MMKSTISAILLSIPLIVASVSSAEEMEVWHGWMNLDPCVTVEYPSRMASILYLPQRAARVYLR